MYGGLLPYALHLPPNLCIRLEKNPDALGAWFPGFSCLGRPRGKMRQGETPNRKKDWFNSSSLAPVTLSVATSSSGCGPHGRFLMHPRAFPVFFREGRI